MSDHPHGPQNLHPATSMMSHGYDPTLSEGAIKPPVFLTSTFAFPSAEAGAAEFARLADPQAAAASDGPLIYSRFNHPNLEIVEQRLALLDGHPAALVTASGMAAISTLTLGLLSPGDVLLHSTPLYGGTDSLFNGMLARYGIRAMPFDATADDAAIDTALSAAGPALAMVYLETPANPTNRLIDLERVAERVDAHATRTGKPVHTACDNTLLGPIFQQPAHLGIDFTVYSLTKYVGGHSDLVAGALCGASDAIRQLRGVRSAIGSQLDPHSSWMLLRSMETLHLRMERAADSAEKVAAWLSSTAPVACEVLHPAHATADKALFERQCRGAGSTFSIVLPGGREAAFAVLNRLRLFRLAVSLGGTESLACHPASTTHAAVAEDARAASGVSEGLIRLSVGLEHPDDLINDLEQALAVLA